MSAMDFEARVRAKWAEKMAFPAAFNFGLDDLPSNPSLSVNNATAWSSDDARQKATITSSLPNTGKKSDTTQQTQFPSTFCSIETRSNIPSLNINDTGDNAEESRVVPTSKSRSRSNSWDTEQYDRFDAISNSELKQTVSVSNVTAQQNYEGQADVCDEPRFHCSTEVSTRSPDVSSGKEEMPELCMHDDRAKTKTASLKSEELFNPHADPRFHCRPKVRTGKPNLSSKRSGKKNIPEVPKCDEKFECEAWQKGEATAKLALRRCPKNPGHKMFHPVKEFSLNDLPEEYQSQVYLKGIKSVADLTMRIGVAFTSNARPPSDVFAKYSGTRVKRWGTGFVHTRLFGNNTTNMEFPDDFTDPGQEDSGLENDFSAKYADKHYEMRIKHFFESFFPPRENSKRETVMRVMERGMKIARGAKGFFDWIADYNDIHNSRDFDGIFDNNDDFNHLYSYKVIQFLQSLNLRDTSHFVKSLPKTFLSSDLGKVALKICEMKELWFGRLYRRQQPMTKCERAYRLLCRSKRREPGITCISNFCGKIRKDNDLDPASHDDGDYEFFRYDDEDEEEDDHRPSALKNEMNKTRCMKTERVTHKPDGRHDHTMYHSVESEDDDGSEDQTDDDWNDDFEIVRPCNCKLCKTTAGAKPKGYSVNVLTARHVVFDREEAENTVVDLFFDDQTDDGVEHLYGVDVHVSSHSGDFAILMCSTHNENLIKKLQKLVSATSKRMKKMKAKSNTPLAVICSHPHGNFKHITVGSWTTREIFRRRDRLPPLWTSYIYDTPTCPGSSGAPVLILGHKSGTLSLDSLLHPHFGNKEGNMNRSSRLVSFYRDLDDMSPKARQRVLEEQNQVYKKIMQELKERLPKEASELRRSAHTIQQVVDTFKKSFRMK